MSAPPVDEAELLYRAQQIAGMRLCDLAEHLSVALPDHLLHAKGLVGQLIEKYLGASAGSRAEPDFLHLGIELKTLPVTRLGKCVESTHVCTAPFEALLQQTWLTSTVYHKLRHVLWVPVDGEKRMPLSERRIGSAILWRPSASELALLQADWEELTEKIRCGEAHTVTAQWGHYLQLRPKAAHGRVLTRGTSSDNYREKSLPLGFYLRPLFTNAVVKAYYTF